MTGAAPPGTDRHRLRDFTRLVADWTWEVDADLRIVALSESAAGALGPAYMFMIGEPLDRAGRLLNGPGGEPPLLRAQRDGAPFRGQRLDVNGRLYELAGAPVPGDPPGFRGIARLADETAPDEPLLATVGRELRAPLDVIIGSAESMAAAGQGALSPHYIDYARDIAAAGRHLMALLGELLDDHGAKAAGGTVDLNEAAAQAMKIVALRAVAKDLDLALSESAHPLPVRADRQHVLQILVNLLTNAVKFTPPGGRIEIEVGSMPAGQASVRVSDTGHGIAPADQERIFGKYERLPGTGEEGTGLGLHIARELARRMGGDLVVESARGQGARFTFLLPPA